MAGDTLAVGSVPHPARVQRSRGTFQSESFSWQP